jgi:hypothetical protein
MLGLTPNLYDEGQQDKQISAECEVCRVVCIERFNIECGV